MSNVLLDHNKKNYFDYFQKAYQSPIKNLYSDSSPPNRYGSANYMQNSYPNNPRRPVEVDSIKNRYGYQADPVSIVDMMRKGGNERNSYSPIRGKEVDFSIMKPGLRGEKEIRPPQQNEKRSFLTHLSEITTNPKKMPEIKPIAGKGLFADWMKDPKDEQVKKEQKKNEWKEYLDSQVNDKQMKKQYEREARIAQELKDEEKFKSQFLLPESYDVHPRNENFIQKTQDSGHYENKGLKGYDLPPIGYPSRYENPYQKDYYLEQHRSMVYEEKPYISAINPVVTFTPLGNQIDMLKRELVNSQKVFGDHLRALKLEVERTTQCKIQAQKDLTVARRRDPSMGLQMKPIDILDNYINKYDLKKDNKQEFKSNLFRSQFTDRVVARDPSNKALEMMHTGSDQTASSRGLIVGVKDQFVKITENVEMNTVDLPQKTNFLLTSVPQKRVEDQDVSIFESQVTSRQNKRRSVLGGHKSILQENLVEPGGFTEDGEWKSGPNEKIGLEREISKIHPAGDTRENVFSADTSLDKNNIQSYDPSLRNLGTKRGENAEKSKFMTAGLVKPDQIESGGVARKLSNERKASGSQLQQYGEGSLNLEGEQKDEKKRDLVRKSNDEGIMKAGGVEEDLTFKHNEGEAERQKQRRVTNLEK